MTDPAPVPLPDPPELPGFVPFTALHAITAGAALGAMVLVVALGVRWRRSGREAILRHALAGAALAAWLAMQSWWLFIADFDVGVNLPLHYCDLAGFLAPFALVLGDRARWLRSTYCFWALALSSQAFVQPVLREGPDHIRFWLFWISHLFIVGVAAYDAVVLRYRPTVRDAAVAYAITLAYAAALIPFDLALGVNYGYVGDAVPENRTLLQRLGPWPFRLVPLALMVAAAYALLWLVLRVLPGARAAGDDR